MIRVVWFKRDLRARDNEALASIVEQGPVLPLCIVEPDRWCQPDSSSRQRAFCLECRNIPERHGSRRGLRRFNQHSPQEDLFGNDA